ncbi:BamA/TamA family outer membrane protein [Nibribacter ruber]|uniref:BamA/TamA family outer membrane protein n=1 Tax=Nibribacter ruber TaxID=2698458 RepID=A0A6P1NXK7_9BACT|nr:BamA/TamA family outer membrane protein [Nibribacter ruber]QHL86401.1 BamA/TamA family outer membrane protein [Nibribacter ruber]
MLCLLAGCSPTRHLAENEKLLRRIKLEGVKQNDKAAIASLYRQKPNRRVLGIPLYLHLYYLGKKFYNPDRIQREMEEETTDFNRKIARAGSDSVHVDKLIERKENKLAKLQNKMENGNWMMRTVGEPPAIFDSLLLVESVDQVKLYLNSKGFFRSEVTASKEEKDKKVYVTLHIDEDEPFKIVQHSYAIPDTAVLALVKSSQANSFIKLQQNFEESVLTQERSRMEGLLKNNGYYDFRQQYVTFEADTSYEAYSVRLVTQVANPTDSTVHKVYTINKVSFISDAGTTRFGRKRDTLLLNNVYYLAYRQRFSPKILDRKVIIRPGQKYSNANTLANQQLLSSLDMFKYTTINYTKLEDSVQTQNKQALLDATINTSPLPRFQETTELGATFTERVPGPYTSLRFRIRNIFGGAELFDIGVRAGVEGQLQISDGTVGRRTEIGTDLGITFPQFLVPFNTNSILVSYNPRTRVSTGYTYVDRNEYTRTNFNVSLDYIWQKKNVHQFSFSPIDLNIISVPRIEPTFRDNLVSLEAQGYPLLQSFNDAFVSSIHFTSLYNTANYNQTNDAKLVRLFVESGGFLGQYLAKSFKSLNTYKFMKGSFDYRRYHPLGKNMMFVYRGNVGLAKPMGGSQILPYDKFFFAGGPSSVRAWLPRRLGPGSSASINVSGNSVNYDFEKPGEILIELNSEYRFRMFRFGTTSVNGAVFLDAGNVWLFKEGATTPGSINGDPEPDIISQPGAKFEFNRFYQELAVGTGFGVRFDFGFAILRFDIATKVHDPARAKGDRFVLGDFNPNKVIGNSNQTTFNLGIGYPF